MHLEKYKNKKCVPTPLNYTLVPTALNHTIVGWVHI
jgi:hypothetical protein